jgi:deoxyribonuclease-4
MAVKFGPSGLGKIKDALNNLKEYSELGLKACEIAFTYSIYINKKEDALEIGKRAEELGISLSIHAPYWINLNSKEKEKIEKSKERLLKCLEIGTWLGAKSIVFHPGFYSGIDKKESFENIKREILELQKIRQNKKYTPELCPETMGKINVFGNVDEIFHLAEETKCSFCLDFAHILARYKKYNFEKILRKFQNFKNFHIHFSGIEYSEKGEKKHIETDEEDIKKLISFLPENKNIVIINESPFPLEDSLKSLKIYEKNKKNN